MRKPTKFLDFDVTVSATKDASQECIIEGYANTSTKDRVGDVVLPAAFESSIKTYLDNPVLLENHDWGKPVGVTQNAEITDKGLFVRCRISDTCPDLKQKIREGCLRTFSIGYNELNSDFDEATKTKIVKDIELLEISVVSVPANPEAKFTEVSSNNPIPAPKEDGNAENSPKEVSGSTEEKPSASAPLPKSFTLNVSEFISSVEEVFGSELDHKSLIAVCDYYSTNEEKMTKKELIDLLKAKSVVTTTETVNKADAPAPAAPAADAPKADDSSKVLDAIMAKLDQLAQAVAKLLEDEAAEDSAEEAPEAKPADAPAADAAKPADDAQKAAPCAQCGGEMAKEPDSDGMIKCMKCGAPADGQKSIEDLEKEIAELDSVIAQLD